MSLLRRFDPRFRAMRARDLRAQRTGAPYIAPAPPVSNVTSWLRLQASAQTGGEWSNWFDVLNPTIPGKINSARRPAVASSSPTGLPVADFQTNDCVSWPINATNFNVNTLGFFWQTNDDGGGVSHENIAINSGTGGASASCLRAFTDSSDNLFVQVFTATNAGRQFRFAAGRTPGVGRVYGLEYDGSIGGDNCLTMSIDGIITTPTVVSNIGVGGTLGPLINVTGNILLGNAVDGSGTNPLVGKVGPNIFAITSKMGGATQGLLTTAARETLATYDLLFVPSQLAAVSGWLRLQSSTQSAGEWTSIVDSLNSNPVSMNSARRTAVGTSANGLPTAVFDGTSPDTWVWPLQAYNNGTTHFGIGMWVKPAGVGAGNQTICEIVNGTNGSDVPKMFILQSTTSLIFQIFKTDADGRFLTVPNVFAAGTWVWIRVDWTSARSADDRCRIYVNGVNVSSTGTYSDFGLGGFPTDMRVATGNMLFGNINDGTPSGPWAGEIGPNVYTTSADLTAGPENALRGYQRPT